MLDLLDALVVALILVHLYVAPYTKVEESFNIHAVYDFVNHGLEFAKFNHLTFPGPVQRTFVGLGFYGLLTRYLVPYLPVEPTQLNVQLLARALLGLVNAFGLIYLRHAVESTIDLVHGNPELDVSIFAAATVEKNGDIEVVEEEEIIESSEESRGEPRSTIGAWFLIFQLTHFHVLFYSSRFLPNFIALPLTNVALGLAIKGNYPLSFCVLSFTSIVFRSDVAPLLVSLFFVSTLVFGKAPFYASVAAGFFGFSFGGIFSFLIDLKVWNPELLVIEYLKDPALGTIPEISSFVYNVIEKNASNWGTLPFFTYFNVFLRKIFFPPAVMALAIPGIANDPTRSLCSISIVGLASFGHILIMSLQPHKELRFIAYDISGIMLLASSGAAKYWKTRSSSVIARLAVIGTTVSCILGFFVSLFMLYVLSKNYPGGEALQAFNQYFLERIGNGTLPGDSVYTVHLEVMPKMTGANLFGELQDEFLKKHNISLVYDKTEDSKKLIEAWPLFDYLITDVPPSYFEEVSLAEFNPEIKTRIATVSGTKWSQIALASAFINVSPRPLFIENQFQPVKAVGLTLEEVIKTRSLVPIVNFVKSAVFEAPVVFVYEKNLVV